MRIMWLLAAFLFLSVSLFAVDSDGAMYVGGTFTAKIPEKTEGKLDLSQETVAKFVWKKGEAEIAYDKIDSIEYGQKAGRRVGVAVMVSPIALFSKKRKHYLTLGFNDKDGKPQGVVLELGKDTVRQALSIFEARTGRKVEYESEEAKKHVGN